MWYLSLYRLTIQGQTTIKDLDKALTKGLITEDNHAYLIPLTKEYKERQAYEERGI